MNLIQQMIIYEEITKVMKNLMLFLLEHRLMGRHADRMTGYLWMGWLSLAFS